MKFLKLRNLFKLTTALIAMGKSLSCVYAASSATNPHASQNLATTQSFTSSVPSSTSAASSSTTAASTSSLSESDEKQQSGGYSDLPPELQAIILDKTDDKEKRIAVLTHSKAHVSTQKVQGPNGGSGTIDERAAVRQEIENFFLDRNDVIRSSEEVKLLDGVRDEGYLSFAFGGNVFNDDRISKYKKLVDDANRVGVSYPLICPMSGWSDDIKKSWKSNILPNVKPELVSEIVYSFSESGYSVDDLKRTFSNSPIKAVRLNLNEQDEGKQLNAFLSLDLAKNIKSLSVLGGNSNPVILFEALSKNAKNLKNVEFLCLKSYGDFQTPEQLFSSYQNFFETFLNQLRGIILSIRTRGPGGAPFDNEKVAPRLFASLINQKWPHLEWMWWDDYSYMRQLEQLPFLLAGLYSSVNVTGNFPKLHSFPGIKGFINYPLWKSSQQGEKEQKEDSSSKKS